MCGRVVGGLNWTQIISVNIIVLTNSLPFLDTMLNYRWGTIIENPDTRLEFGTVRRISLDVPRVRLEEKVSVGRKQEDQRKKYRKNEVSTLIVTHHC